MQNYCPLLRKVIAAPDSWLEFAMFGGPRLDSVTHHGHIVLIGDASHRESPRPFLRIAPRLTFLCSTFRRLRCARANLLVPSVC